MARVTVEDCLDKVPGRFSLVMLVAKRAKQILKGDAPSVASKDNKPVVIALREVAMDNVKFDAVTREDLINEAEKDLARLAPVGRPISSDSAD